MTLGMGQPYHQHATGARPRAAEIICGLHICLSMSEWAFIPCTEGPRARSREQTPSSPRCDPETSPAEVAGDLPVGVWEGQDALRKVVGPGEQDLQRILSWSPDHSGGVNESSRRACVLQLQTLGAGSVGLKPCRGRGGGRAQRMPSRPISCGDLATCISTGEAENWGVS